MEREGIVVLGRPVEHVTIEVLQLEEPEIVVARCARHPHEDSGRSSLPRIARARVDAAMRTAAAGDVGYARYAGVTTPSAVCARYGSSAPRSSALVQRV